MSTQDQRHFHRIAHDAYASLESGGVTRACQVLDVSFKGCLVRLNSDWTLDPEQEYALLLHLAPGRDIRMHVRLAHQEGVLAGLHCVELDLDSATELRRLVEFNLGNPALLERELHALVRP